MIATSLLLSLGLLAAACSDKKDEVDTGGGGTDTTAAEEPTTTAGGGGTDTTVAEETTTTAAPAVEPVAGGKLVVAGEAEVANPWLPSVMQCDSYCQMRARSFFDPLVVIDEDLQWRPFLAESVEANADSTVFTIKVREGITFTDGSALNADVVIDNLNRGAKSLLIGAAVKDLAKGADGNLVTEKIDDYTFTIATGLNGDPASPLPWPLFPYYLGGQFGLIGSSDWLAAVDGGTAQPDQPVGTGPFTLDSYAPGDKLVVKKNPGYWLKDASGNALPYLDEIEFRVIPDSQVRATALESGDVDLISTSDGAVISDFDGNTDYNLILQQDFAETNYVMFHLSKAGPLQSKEVRCALLQAIDKVDIIDVISNGYLDPANGPFSPGQEGFLEDNGSLPYDPDAAAAAIETYEAANGPVAVNYSTTTAASSLATAQYLQDAWGQIGVDVTIDQIEQSKLINNALFGDPAFDAFGWRNHAGVFVDQQYFWWHSSAALPDGQLALNFGRLSDPVIDDLLEKSRSEADPDVRRGYAEDINRQFAKECWIIPTSYTKWGVISNLSVQGVGTTPQADGKGVLRDGAGFPGQVWLTAVFKTA
jgi:ABC-type transport system substrate-binding protein